MIEIAIVFGILIVMIVNINLVVNVIAVLILLIILIMKLKNDIATANKANEIKNEESNSESCMISKDMETGEKFLNINDLQNLNIIDEIIIKKTETEEVLADLVKLIRDMTGVEKIVAYRKEDSKRSIIIKEGDFNKKNDILSVSDKKGKIVMLNNSEIGNEYFDVAISFRNIGEEVLVCPIVVDNGEYGAIILVSNIDKNTFNKDNKILISYLINQSRIAIESTKMQKKILDNTRIENEVMIASEIQKKLLPQDMRFAFGLEIANFFKPAKEVGGDYYDYFISAEGLLGIAVGDVSGKGVPASLIMTLVRAVLRTLASYDIQPDDALTKLNQILYGDMGNEMFVTLVYSLYDEEERELYISNAGHNPIIIYNSRSEEIVEKKIKGAAIGFLDSYHYRLKKIKLNYGDTIVYYTDGITEAENEHKALFGKQRLLNLIKKYGDLSAEQLKKKILEKVFEFQGRKEQADDITLVVLKVKH